MDLGLTPERAAIRAYNGAVKEEFIEVESGRNKERPELRRALERCKQTHSTLLVAKLDRLARSVSFISALMDSGVDFVCCDYPEANRLMLHILASVGEWEARLISERTKAALRAAKERGVKLGNPNLTEEARAKGREVWSRKANEDKSRVLPTIQALQAQGHSLRGIARELNQMEIKTPRGKQWTATAVKNTMPRTKNVRK